MSLLHIYIYIYSSTIIFLSLIHSLTSISFYHHACCYAGLIRCSFQPEGIKKISLSFDACKIIRQVSAMKLWAIYLIIIVILIIILFGRCVYVRMCGFMITVVLFSYMVTGYIVYIRIRDHEIYKRKVNDNDDHSIVLWWEITTWHTWMNDRLKIVNSYSDAKMLLDFGELRRNGRERCW